MSKKQRKNEEKQGVSETTMRFRDTHHIGRKTLKLYANTARDHREKRQYTQHLKVQRRA